MTIKTVVTGGAGRMGRTLISAILASEEFSLHGATEAMGHAQLGADLGTLTGGPPAHTTLTDDLLTLIKSADAVIDFTVPHVSVEVAALAAQARIVHVLGTTGFSKAEEAAIAAAARHATIIRSGNFSLGVNLLAGIARRLGAQLSEDFDVEIVEMHHRMKTDAPSGTALLLGTAVADGRGVDLNAAAVRGRDGITGARKKGTIGFAALRGGAVVGEHTVIFAADDEQIEITHKAGSRSIFARGALLAAKWGQGRGPGLFSMTDVLGP